ncbi:MULTISPECIES: hypothetical protein [Methanosarcina]|uniref:hypothetical protein n=1 Tax=Methanosarcina TaxID=2207 RepID=UPI000AA0B0DD|nr:MULTISPECIES: hypothetical protein [Methanosarcina]MDW5549113.1 hypothetical protein [Methanosarcina sp.]MDW5549142.1 hypothetical protein [Methanosarcina sp.]MDW5553153.1 hypothetical protein [Methanosarcina sp.]MDW5559321.1 hypothetical protein [Methanosarcina sp.]
METMTSTDKDLPSWAAQTCTNHLEILENMRKSTDATERAIAKRIMQIAGVEKSD